MKGAQPALTARRGRIVITDGPAAPAATAGIAAPAGAVAEGPPQLAGGGLQPRRAGHGGPGGPAIASALNGTGAGGHGVLDVAGPSGPGGSETSQRRTILDYGRGNGGGGGGLAGRRAKLVEAVDGRTIAQREQAQSGEGKHEVAEVELNGNGVSMTISGQIKGRKILKSVAPDYPEKAKRQGWEGIVAVHFTVLADGRVKDNMYFEQTSVHSDLNQAATKALKEFLFAPLPAEQAAVEQWGVITIIFRLN
jgi:TonB family protein